MIKGSGINYFAELNGLNDLWDVFYTFESGNSLISSMSQANPIYSGAIIGSEASFWSKPGSGLFTGASVSIYNHTGLVAPSFTHIFSFEETSTGKQVLYSNIDNASGYEIGLTDTKKIYAKTHSSDGPVVIATNFNLSSKNLITVSYLNNFFEFGYYNFNSQNLETEGYTQLSDKILSNKQALLGPELNGYMDYYLYFNVLLNSNILNTVISGVYNVPTGYVYETETICSETITGYQSIPYFTSGITGYGATTLFSEGVGDYTGLFPITGIYSGMSGIIESGFIQSGLTQSKCVTYTGGKLMSFTVLSGYSDSFQMDKVICLGYIDSDDFVKISKENLPYRDFYNKNGSFLTSGFQFDWDIYSGNSNIYINGVAYTNSGYLFDQNIISNEFFSYPDHLILDISSGRKLTDEQSPYTIPYIGQELFLNGVNLTSGKDFIFNGTNIILTGQNTGISGILFEFPIILNNETGSKNLWTGKLQRNTSRVYLNGVRQINGVDYVEGGNFDLLTGNKFNQHNTSVVMYDKNGDFFE
jgi:hypothetical protein